MDKLSPRVCLQCSKSLSGRVDKKFCDAFCRNTFNNQNKPDDERYLQWTNSTLRKNRRILKTLCPEGKATVRKEVLDQMGYDFSCFTGQFKTSNITYYMVYDFGFAPIREKEIEKALIVHRQEYMSNQDVNPWYL